MKTAEREPAGRRRVYRIGGRNSAGRPVGESLKSHRPAAGDEVAWARWQLRHMTRLAGPGPEVEVVVLAGSSKGTAGR